MKRTVLISRDLRAGLSLAARFARAGDDVRAVLLDSAVAVLRPGHPSASAVEEAAADGVEVCAHDEALRRRAITEPERVAVVGLDAVADGVADGTDLVGWL